MIDLKYKTGDRVLIKVTIRSVEIENGLVLYHIVDEDLPILEESVIGRI